MSDNSRFSVTRRGFLGTSACTLAGLTLTGCESGGLRFFSDAEASEPGAGGSYEKFSVCANCVNKCGIKAKVVAGRLKKLDPNPHFPKSRSMLCAKGQAGVQVLYDKDRLKHPLIRTGPRGSGQFRQASWEEALDHVAEGLAKIRDKYGASSVLFSSTEGLQEHFFREFSAAFGSANHVRHPSLCLASGNVGFFSVFGTVPAFDVANTQYMIFSGANRLESFITPDTIDLVDVLEKKKAKLVYLDPRYTVTASKADTWLPIKPGTDLAFYLALIHVLITEELYDKDFVARYTIGFDEVAAGIAGNTPEWAEQECGVPARQIREIAREFAYHAPRSFIYKGRRTSWTTNDTPMRQAMAIANALVGNWDREGGLVPKQSLRKGEVDLDVWPPLPDQDCIVSMEEKHPLANAGDGTYLDFREKVMLDEPYPIRGWFVYKQNPMHSLPDRGLTRRMIDKMEFVVVTDIMPTDTAWLADVILPESSYLEREDPVVGFQDPYPFLSMRNKVVDPVHDTKPNFEIMQELSRRLGFPEFFDYKIKAMQRAQLEPFGLEPESLEATGMWSDRKERTYGKSLKEGYRFRTPSGKIELASERFRRRGYNPVPVYEPQDAIPGNQFKLLVGKNAYFTHASNQNNPWLHELMPDNGLWLNSKPAAQRGISNGDIVRVKSAVGEVEVRAIVTERIRPDCVHLPHGFDHISPLMSRVHGAGACDSDLLISREDHISGNAALHETLVTVERIGDGKEVHA
ncbi:MAG: molybdopterin-dependent oxidoreductase [Acidobacteria bacterium]|uniref:Molybdopterin-dependent oxidoreductase n=1 Tax=Candidatus Polarisedimenticola svalbardensis TaxID=2886004 RepID=A0A8J7C2P0_9BACT|nr:molybdopterin-dependent oxidoreductase [Candidatus Polarisedimenticola svalbardensis]